jgi:hypothetical protein
MCGRVGPGACAAEHVAGMGGVSTVKKRLLPEPPTARQAISLLAMAPGISPAPASPSPAPASPTLPAARDARQRPVLPGTSAYVSIRQHTSEYVSIRQHTSSCVSIRQHTSACVSIRQHTSEYVSIRQHTSAYVSMPQHTSAYISIRQHASACVGMRQHTALTPLTNSSTLTFARRQRHCMPKMLL